MYQFWSQAEVRLLTFFKTGTTLDTPSIVQRLDHSEAQLPFHDEPRGYSIKTINTQVHTLRYGTKGNLLLDELKPLNGKLPSSYTAQLTNEFIRIIRDNNLTDSRMIAQAAYDSGLFGTKDSQVVRDSVDGLENFFWVLRRQQVILGADLGEPRSWPPHWMSHLVDLWNHLCTIPGSVDEKGKFIDYVLLARLMDLNISFLGTHFTALDMEKAERQAIKWGFLRSAYADAVILDDGPGLKVNKPVTAQNQTPALTRPPITPQQMNDFGRTAALTATIPAHMPLLPMVIKPRPADASNPDGSSAIFSPFDPREFGRPSGPPNPFGAGPSGSRQSARLP